MGMLHVAQLLHDHPVLFTLILGLDAQLIMDLANQLRLF